MRVEKARWRDRTNTANTFFATLSHACVFTRMKMSDVRSVVQKNMRATAGVCTEDPQSRATFGRLAEQGPLTEAIDIWNEEIQWFTSSPDNDNDNDTFE